MKKLFFLLALVAAAAFPAGAQEIVKGAIDDTLINILNELNSQLNIGYIVNYE